MSRCLAVLAGAVAVSVVGYAPAAAADPSSSANGRSASTVVDDLESQGYNVQINWVNGFDTKPLSDCWVTGVNNPGDTAPTDGTFTTVYVDVSCPNGDGDRGSFGIGVGIG
ncbi:hypothetical protein [Mycolicibacterium hodleri]|uniref:PASTA domain-containing protein n=1 Tax=Mycolicibacterium hodleri TaxID=49897 RepID=A0A502DVM5_9MYCO|nr:hypothetical protein [Mycolicibacterium hodleri]TPG28276.1 hypothetical protein EAH80_27405 [Mycolicibacterium hodleri]